MDQDEDDFFGYSVSISADYLIVGAHGDDDNGPEAGAAYIFQRQADSWIQTAKIKPGDGAAGMTFGWSVSISGDRAVVGAVFDNETATESGSIYVFERSGGSWQQAAKLSASDGAAADWFGESVAISDKVIAVGADGDDDNGNDSGSGYFYDLCFKTGDLDNSGDIDLGDAIVAMQIVTGAVPSIPVFAGREINLDNRIGLEESLYILQRIVELRP